MPHLIFVPTAHAADTSADIGRQTTLVLATLDERLRTHRSSLADTVVITVYLRDAADFAAMNEAYRQAWTGAPPTRTTVVRTCSRPALAWRCPPLPCRPAPIGVLVHPQSWMAPPNPYSYAIRAGDTLFLSGVDPEKRQGQQHGAGDVAVQTRTVMENARELLEAAGLSLAHLVSARAFLPNLDDFAEFNRVYRELRRRGSPGACDGRRAAHRACLQRRDHLRRLRGVAPGHRDECAAESQFEPGGQRGTLLFVSGLLAEADALARDPGAQTRDIIASSVSPCRKRSSHRATCATCWFMSLTTRPEGFDRGVPPGIRDCAVDLTGGGAPGGRRCAGRDHGVRGARNDPAANRHLVVPARRGGAIRRRPQARPFLTQILDRYVEWVRVCPEVEVGHGRAARDAAAGARRRRHADDHDAHRHRSHRRMRAWAERRTTALAGMDLRGYVLKKDSPSCGMERVKVYGDGGGARDRRGHLRGAS